MGDPLHSLSQNPSTGLLSCFISMAEIDEDQPESRRGPNLICQDMQGGPPIGGGQWHGTRAHVGRALSLPRSFYQEDLDVCWFVCWRETCPMPAAMDLEALETDQKAIKSKLEPFSEENQTSPV